MEKWTFEKIKNLIDNRLVNSRIDLSTFRSIVAYGVSNTSNKTARKKVEFLRFLNNLMKNNV